MPAAAAASLIGIIAFALPAGADPVYAMLFVAGALMVFVWSIRVAITGLAVSRTEVRVRRILVTVRVPWAEVDRFDLVRGPHVFREKWAVLRHAIDWPTGVGAGNPSPA